MDLRRRIAATLVLVMLACSVLSCQLFRTGPTDEELVGRVLEQFARGLNEKNIDLIEASLSEDFQGLQGEPKPTVIETMPQVFEMGPTVDLMETQITVEGDTATASPVNINAMGSVIKTTFHFVKRDGKWLISRHAPGS